MWCLLLETKFCQQIKERRKKYVSEQKLCILQLKKDCCRSRRSVVENGDGEILFSHSQPNICHFTYLSTERRQIAALLFLSKHLC